MKDTEIYLFEALNSHVCVNLYSCKRINKCLIIQLTVIWFLGTGETVSIVGDTDPSLMKFFDCTRSAARSPFDDDVVYQFEYMEYVCSQTPSTIFVPFCSYLKMDKPVINHILDKSHYKFSIRENALKQCMCWTIVFMSITCGRNMTAKHNSQGKICLEK